MIINLKNAEHYTWGAGCEGWHHLNFDSLSVIRERMPARTSEARHYHTKSQQLFYLLDGKALMEMNDEEFHFKASDSIRVPPGAKHQIRNV